MFSTVCVPIICENESKKQLLESINAAKLYVENSINPAKLLSINEMDSPSRLAGH